MQNSITWLLADGKCERADKAVEEAMLSWEVTKGV